MAWDVSRAEVRWGGKMWCYFPGQIERVFLPARKSVLLCSDTTDKWKVYQQAGLSYSWCHCSGCNKIKANTLQSWRPQLMHDTVQNVKKCTVPLSWFQLWICNDTRCFFLCCRTKTETGRRPSEANKDDTNRMDEVLSESTFSDFYNYCNLRTYHTCDALQRLLKHFQDFLRNFTFCWLLYHFTRT